MEEIYRLDARHRPRLWAAMMHARAAENTNISFEGMLSHTELAQMEGVGHEESDVLKRSTLQPKRDFRILPLTPQNVSAIVKAITSKIAFGNGGIIHVQIEGNGKMAFAAYDDFDRECVVLRVARRTDNDRSFAKLHPGRPTDQLTVENSARPIHRVLIAMAVLDGCSSRVYNAAQSSNEI
jgi:hypothetical protein